MSDLQEPASSAPVTGIASAGGNASGAGEFTAVEGKEHFNGETLMVEAYVAIWVVLMAWILFLWRKQASMSLRLDDLERAIDRAAALAEKNAQAKRAAAVAAKAKAKPEAAV
jgi:CcmD family protein